MHKQQTNGIQGKPKSELWIPIAYAIFYFPTFKWLNAHNFPRYYIGCRLDDLIPFCEWFVIPYVAWFFIIPAMLLLMHSIAAGRSGNIKRFCRGVLAIIIIRHALHFARKRV